MQRAARVSAAIETLDIILAEVKADGHTTVQVLRYYFADKPYIEASDRKAIGDIVFAILRLAIPLSWAIEDADAEVNGRNLILAHCQWTGVDLQDLFGSGRYAPDALSDDDRDMLWALPDRKDAPHWARLNCPKCMYDSLKKRFGDGFDAEMLALEKRAPFIARVNSLVSNTANAVAALMKAGVNARLSSRTPNCIFLSSAKVKNLEIYKKGGLDIQDQSGQIVSLLVAAKPGQKVLDMCSGGGAKTCAIAAWMKNQGQIIASDINPKRIHELPRRAEILNVKIIEAHTVSKDHKFYREQLYSPLGKKMDRVLVDAPCSGTGSWRQHPENRLRVSSERMGTIIATQQSLLLEGADCVKPGGRLIYSVGSILPAEAEEQVEWFLKNRAEKRESWSLLDYRDVWREQLMGRDPRESLASIPECLLLSPASSESNGYFVAIFERG